MKFMFVLFAAVLVNTTAHAGPSIPVVECKSGQNSLMIHYSVGGVPNPNDPTGGISTFYGTYFTRGNPVWSASLNRVIMNSIPEQELRYYDTFSGNSEGRKIMLGLTSIPKGDGVMGELHISKGANSQITRMTCRYLK